MKAFLTFAGNAPMSSAFMVLIAVLYLAAAGSFAYEQKWAMSGLSLCWGIGNALLAHISR